MNTQNQVTKLFSTMMHSYKTAAAAGSVLMTGMLLASSYFAAHLAETNATSYVPPENRIVVTAPRLVTSQSVNPVKLAHDAGAPAQAASRTN